MHPLPLASGRPTPRPRPDRFLVLRVLPRSAGCRLSASSPPRLTERGLRGGLRPPLGRAGPGARDRPPWPPQRPGRRAGLRRSAERAGATRSARSARTPRPRRDPGGRCAGAGAAGGGGAGAGRGRAGGRRALALGHARFRGFSRARALCGVGPLRGSPHTPPPPFSLLRRGRVRDAATASGACAGTPRGPAHEPRKGDPDGGTPAGRAPAVRSSRSRGQNMAAVCLIGALGSVARCLPQPPFCTGGNGNSEKSSNLAGFTQIWD